MITGGRSSARSRPLPVGQLLQAQPTTKARRPIVTGATRKGAIPAPIRGTASEQQKNCSVGFSSETGIVRQHRLPAVARDRATRRAEPGVVDLPEHPSISIAAVLRDNRPCSDRPTIKLIDSVVVAHHSLPREQEMQRYRMTVYAPDVR